MVLIAVVMKTRLPHTTGLEWARPGIRVFHLMLVPFSAFQLSGRFCPSAIPEAWSPRNEGQLFGPFAPATLATANATLAKTSRVATTFINPSTSRTMQQKIALCFFSPFTNDLAQNGILCSPSTFNFQPATLHGPPSFSVLFGQIPAGLLAIGDALGLAVPGYWLARPA